MGLQEAQRSFKFAGGVETKADPKAVPATKLLALENGVFTKAISIQKRNGVEALAQSIDGGTTITGGRRLGARDRELLQFTLDRCYSRHSGADEWSDMGVAISAVGTDRSAVQTSSQQTLPDHATNDGTTVYAWEDSRGGVWWTVVDAVTGAQRRAPTQADANGQRPRCLAVGSVLHIYYAVPTQRRIMVIVVNPSNPSVAVTPAILADDLNQTNPVYDACATPRTGTPALMVWSEHGTTNYRVGYIDASGVLGGPLTGHPTTATVLGELKSTTPIACHYLAQGVDVGRVFVAFVYDDPAVTTLGRVYVDTHDLTAPVPVDVYNTPTNVQRIALTADDVPNVYTVFEEAAAEPSQRYSVCVTMDISGTPAAPRTLRSVGLASRGFFVANSPCAVFVHDTTYFNVYLTLRLSDFAPASRTLPGEAAGAPTRSHLSSVHVVDNVATLVLPAKTRLASANNDKFGETATRKIVLDFDNDDSKQNVQIGMGLYMAGACPLHYDGRAWTEQGFHVGPELMDYTALGAGSLTPSTTYSYVVWYEWTDALGEIHRGPTSVPLVVPLGAGDDEVELQVPTLRVTQKTNVRICVARSLPGDASRLFRVTSLDPTTSGAAANGYLANDTTVDFIVWVDRMSDTDLQEQEPLYTNGGILSNDPVPLGSIVCGGKNRLFFVDSSNGNIVRFSQRIASGYGLEITPELKLDVDPYGGDITALAVMDKKVYAFKRAAIFRFGGDGPLENGSTATSGFTDTDRVSADIGCVDPSSIVDTTIGLMFRSDKGIYLLARDESLTYIGAAVERYNAQTVRRASVLADRNQVVFLTDSGKSLLFDYLFAQWSTFTNYEGLDSIVVDGRYHYLKTDDRVMRETPGEYSDAGVRITLRFETAWLHLHEHLQGFQRFWNLILLGTRSSPHQLGISYQLDYKDSWSEPYWLDATGDSSPTGWLTGDNCATIGEDPIDGTGYGDGPFGDGPYGGEADDIYQWRFGIHENGQAVRFRFEDYEKAGISGASFELTEMTIVGGIIASSIRPFSGARGA